MANKELMITLGLDDSSYTQKIKRANDLNRELDSSFKLLSSSSDKFEKSIQGLGKKQEYLAQKIKIANSASEEHIKRIKESEDALEKAKQSAEMYREAIENGTGSIKDNTQLLAKANKAIYENERRILEAQKSYNESQASIQNFSREIEFTSQKLDALKGDDKINAIKDSISNLDHEFEITKNSIANFSNSMQGLDESQTYYNKRIEETKTMLKAYSDEMDYSNDILNLYGSELENVGKELEEWDSILSSMKGNEPDYNEAREKVQALRSEYSQINQIMEFHKERISTLGTEYKNTEIDIAKMSGTLDTNAQKIQKMNESITFEKASSSIKELTNSTITDLENKLKDLDSNFQILETSAKGYEQTLTGLNTQQEYYQKSVALTKDKVAEYGSELAQIKTKVSELSNEQTNLETSIEGYISELKNLSGADWDNQVAKINEAKKQYEEVNKSLELHKKRLDKVEDGYRDSNQSLAEFKASLKEVNSSISNFSSKNVFDNLDKTIDRISDSMSVLESKFKLAQSKVLDFGKSKKDLAQKTEYYRDKIGLLEDKLSVLNTKLEESKNKSEQLGNKQKELASKVSETSDKMQSMSDKSSTAYQQLVVELNEYEAELKQVNDEMYESTRKHDGLQTEINQTASEINSLAKEMGTLKSDFTAETFDNVGNKLQKVGSGISNLGSALMPASLAVAGVGASAIKTGMDFETSMTKVGALMDANEQQMQQLEETARQLGATTTYSATDAAEGLGYLGLAGYEVGVACERLPGILKLAQVGTLDLATTSDLVTDSFASLGGVVEDNEAGFSAFLNTVATGANKTNADVEQILQSFIKVGGQLDTLDIDLTQSTTMLGVLASRGIKAEEAGNALNSILINMTKKSGESAEAMETLGVSVFDAKGNIRDIEDVMVDLGTALANLKTEEERVNLINMIGGKTQAKTLQKLIQGMTDDTGKLSDEYKDLKASIEADINTDSLTRISEQMTDNLEGDVAILKSTIQESFLTIYETVQPTLREIVQNVTQIITDITEKFKSLSPETQDFITKMAVGIVALAPLLTITGKATSGLGGLSKGFGTVAKLAGRFATKGALAKGAVSGVASATAGASGAVSGLSSTFTIFGTAISGATVLIGAIVVAILAVITAVGQNNDALAWLQEKWGTFGTVVGGVCEYISGRITFFFKTAMSVFKSLGKSIVAIFTGDWGSIDDIWREGFNDIETIAKESWSDIKMESTRALTVIRESTEEELSGLQDVFDKTLENLPKVTVDNLSEVASTFTDTFKDLSNDSLLILRGTSDTMANLLYGISEGMDTSELQKKLESNMDALLKAGKVDASELEKDFKKASELISKNIVDSFDRAKNQADSIIKQLGYTAVIGLDKVSEGVADIVGKMDEGTFEKLKSIDKQWATLFAGIEDNANMSSTQLKEIILKNLDKMNIETAEQMDEFIKILTGSLEETAESATETVEEVTEAIAQTSVSANEGVQNILSVMKTDTDQSMREFAKTIVGHIETMGSDTASSLKYSTDGWFALLNGAYDENGKLNENFVDTLIGNFNYLGLKTPEQVQAYCSALENGFSYADKKVTETVEGTVETVKEKNDELVTATEDIGMTITENVTPENLEQKVAEAMQQAEDGLNSKKEDFAKEAQQIAEEAETKFREELMSMNEIDLPNTILNGEKIREEMGLAGQVAVVAFAESWAENDYVISDGISATFANLNVTLGENFNGVITSIEEMGKKIGVVGDVATDTKDRLSEMTKINFVSQTQSVQIISDKLTVASESAKKANGSLTAIVTQRTDGLTASVGMTNVALDGMTYNAKEAKVELDNISKVSMTKTNFDFEMAKKKLENLKIGAKNAYEEIKKIVDTNLTKLFGFLDTLVSKLDTVKSKATLAKGALQSMNEVGFSTLLYNLSRVNNALNNIKNNASVAKSYVSGVSGRSVYSYGDGASAYAVSGISDTLNGFARTMSTMDMANYKTSGGYYTPTSMAGVPAQSSVGNNSVNIDIINALTKQNELLMNLLTANRDINVSIGLDGRVVAKSTAPYMESEISKLTNRKNRLGGK